MRGLRPIAFLCGVICVVAVCAARLGARQTPRVQTPQPDNTVHKPADFAGAWMYNALDSVNAATGRPEQAPKSATAGRTGPGGVNTPSGVGGGRGGGGGGARSGASNGPLDDGGSYSTYGPSDDQQPEEAPVGPTFAMVQQSRDLARDLLEVPEAMTIKVTPAAVTFVDDLDHVLTYPTNGSKQRYHLAASDFDAEMQWDGSQLKEHVEGAFGFRMTETYFLSADAERLFVIIRVGDQKKNRPVNGLNRVYDRVVH